MQICFSLPHVFHSLASKPESDAVQRILKEAVNSINHPLLAGRSASNQSDATAANGKASIAFNKATSRACFALPRNFSPSSKQTDDDRVLRILMEVMIAINIEYRKTRSVPHLYDRPVYYARTQVWEPTPALDARGYGDCKSLTADLVAQYRLAGYDAAPVFRWEPSRNPNKRGTNYHILVQTARGFEDPSKVKGMGRKEY